MPFVTGETLRSRLEREKQLPIDEALRIAREVADALGSAHALGIIHRDIKPENILLQGGHALVADFGIALAAQQAGGQRMTQTGPSLGTPQYMSPEQAMGEKPVDARADLYALGAVTYEMLTGDAPFTGSTVQAIVAQVLTEEPLWWRPLRGRMMEAVAAPPAVSRQGTGISSSLQIFRARNSLISRWRGTVADFRTARLTWTECRPPSQKSAHPCCSRWRSKSSRFTPSA
jgi:serine/threonine protein kinase